MQVVFIRLDGVDAEESSERGVVVARAHVDEAGLGVLPFAGEPQRVGCGRCLVVEPFAVGTVGFAPQQGACGVGGGNGGTQSIVVVVDDGVGGDDGVVDGEGDALVDAGDAVSDGSLDDDRGGGGDVGGGVDRGSQAAAAEAADLGNAVDMGCGGQACEGEQQRQPQKQDGAQVAAGEVFQWRIS